VDHIVVFNKLDRDALLEIVNIELAGLEKRLNARGLVLEISDEVRNYLLDQGFEPEFGARPLRRSIERFIEDPLAEDLLRGRYKEGDIVKVDIVQDCITLLNGETKPAEE
jgi:ATP-dependent Clp protease ATP-binding subunit ClpC